MEMICQRCGYKWQSKLNRKPKQCPHCKQTYWDKPAGWEYNKAPINIGTEPEPTEEEIAKSVEEVKEKGVDKFSFDL